MRYCRVCAAAVLILALSSLQAFPQVVRGTVRDRATSEPIADVLITIEAASPIAPSSSDISRGVLSNSAGLFAVSASSAGRYRVIAKRIGSQRYISEFFDLASGQTKQLEIVLDAVLQKLPEVRIATSKLCASREREAAEVAGLWDEARTALAATSISRRDRRVQTHIVRYSRLLDPRSLRVLAEERTDGDVIAGRPFSSVSSDSIARTGYWHEMAGDTVTFYVPDEQVVLSDEFVRDHCFSVSERKVGETHEVGLAFKPVPDRFLPDIQGVMWLDAHTFELHSIAFQYTKVREAEFADKNGGEVLFAHLAGGWIVQRWFSRMPQFRRGVITSNSGTRPSTSFDLPVVYRIVEEGGEATVIAGRLVIARAAVKGVAKDSSGEVLPNAIVELQGTSRRTTTDAQGNFALDSVPAGGYLLVMRTEGYSELGVPAADRGLVLDSGLTTVQLRARTARETILQMCGGQQLDTATAVLRVLLVDSTTHAPLGNVPVRIDWTEYGSPVMGLRPALRRSRTVPTNAAGEAILCNLPADRSLELSASTRSAEMDVLASIRVLANTVTVQKRALRKQ